jgi:hypothetical protein
MSEDEKAKPLANYDPALFPLPSDCALVTYSNDNGEEIDFLLMPLSDDSPPDDQKVHAYEIQRRADDTIDPDRLVNPEKVVSVARGIADCAAIIVATNVGAMYMQRATVEESAPALSMTLKDVTLPKTEGEADSMITRAIVERITTTIGADIFSNAQQALDGYTFIWRHVFSSVLFAIEREHGDLDSISHDTMEALFSEYYDRDLAHYFQRALLSYAALTAAPFLENMNPAAWQIERLREFVGMEPSGEISQSGTTIDIISVDYLSELLEVLKESPEPRGDISYFYSNGQINLCATAGDKIATLSQVNRKRGGSKANYDLSNLESNYNLVYGKWKGAKEIYKQNKDRNWRGMISVEHPNLPDDLSTRVSGDPADLSDETKEALSKKGGTPAASDIALEHAARLCGAPPYRYTIGYLWQVKGGKGKE